MRKIAVVLSSRPQWGKLWPVCQALKANGHKIDLVVCAYAVARHHGILDTIKADGWTPTTIIHAALDANTLETSALTTALLTLRLTGHFATTKPAGVIVNHDRHETLGATIAASYQNIPVLHLGGGESSGSIDDRVRHANTMLSDYHCCSNAEAYGRLVNMGVWLDRIFTTGCPAMDSARLALDESPVTASELITHGTGAKVDPQQPFALIAQHPVTTHPETAEQDLLEAIHHAQDLPRIVLWPGADTGADAMSKRLRSAALLKTRLIRSLPPRRFLRLLSQATLAIGNSSALIREGSYYGVPRIIIGDRQRGRAMSETASPLYGDGYAAPRIAAVCERMIA